MRHAATPVVLLCLLGIGGAVSPAQATPGDFIADRLLGQKTFTQGAESFVEGKGMHDPSSVAIDRSSNPNHLCVADYDNNRVLCWENAATFAKARPASLVIGQASSQESFCNRGQTMPDAKTLCGPAAVAFDADGDLYVADNLNNRIVVFDSPFESGMTADQAASRVFGQAGFTTATCGPGATALCSPVGMAFDTSGNLYVADGLGVFGSNNRVVEFDNPEAAGPGTPGVPGAAGDKTADRVFGQADFGATAIACNRSPGGFPPPPTASTLCGPSDVAIDSAGNLLVADSLNNRVVVYLTPLANAVADFVFGQGDDMTGEDPGAELDELNTPSGLTTDAAGRVWIADTFNGRVLVFNSPFTTDRTADIAFGAGGTFPSRRDIGNPVDVALDTTGNLYVADGMPPVNYEGGYSRVLRLDAPLTTDGIADAVLGQKSYTSFLPNLVDAIGLSAPRRVAFDRSVSPARVYVADVNHNRIVAWSNADSFANGAEADLVIGQKDFKSHACNRGAFNPTANTLCRPFDVDVDSGGNLWVADLDNNRVLEFDAPFDSGLPADQPATRVFGQTSFTVKGQNAGAGSTVSASGFNQPQALAIDGAGRLWVADSANHRILMFKSPLGADHAADFVLGQPSLTTGAAPSTTDADALLFPVEVVVDGQGHVYSADPALDRVLVHLNPLAPGGGTPGTPGSAGDRTADRVFGQADFAQSGCNHFGGRTAQSLCGVNGLGVAGNGSLWIVDGGNHRLLRHDAPLAGDQTADAVVGAPDFTTNASVCPKLRTADRFCFPVGVGFDPSGNLWMAENGSNRVLVFDAVTTPPPPPPTCNGLLATLVGTDSDDNIVGTSGADVIVAGEGDDVVNGGGGPDTICGGAGDDTLKGGAGGDHLFGEGDDDTLVGGAGNDEMDGGGGTDSCRGGTGSNSTSGCE